jgi:hypothetical protein
MRTILFLAFIMLSTTIALAVNGQPYTVRDTMTYFELTYQEISNIYAPTAYGFATSRDWPSKPAVYFRPRSYTGRFKVVSVFGFFIKAGNWAQSTCDVFLCEGLSNSGPQDTKKIGKAVKITPTGKTSELVSADFSDQNLIFDEGESFFVVLGVSSSDGSPYVLCENLNYKPASGPKYKDSGNSWTWIYATPGWQKMSATLWRSSNNFADHALYAVIDYIDVQSAVSTTTWEEIKVNE